MTDEEIKKKYPVTSKDLKLIRKIKDAQIDYSDCPDVAELLAKGQARRVGRPKKEYTKRTISIRLYDYDLAALRKSGRGWQTRISDLVSEQIK
jgi:uncharacterized protein (DUF4415 family)